MAKGTSIKFDDEELEEIKTLAKEVDLDVSKYVRKIIRESKGAVRPPFAINKLPEIKPEPKLNEVKKKMSGELDERAIKSIARETHKEIDMEEKFQASLDNINNTLCVGPDCILERLKKLEPTHKCPNCKNVTLKEGQSKFCPDCGAKIAWEE